MKNTVSDFIKLGEKYNFPVINIDGNYYSLTAKNTDNKSVKWISYNSLTDIVSYIGNTDNCNIWFYHTRKDMIPEKIIEFIGELNSVFDLKDSNKFSVRELIDPEDWQEIADICDAYEDKRYIEN